MWRRDKLTFASYIPCSVMDSTKDSIIKPIQRFETALGNDIIVSQLYVPFLPVKRI